MPRVDSLLAHLKHKGGSDLHLAAGLAPRVRVHGFLEEIPNTPPLDSSDVLEILQEVCQPRHADILARENDVDFAYSLEGVGRFRVNGFVQERGYGAVFRWIPQDIVPLDKLDMPPALGKLPHLGTGLVLITGPTGAGKSTTLAAIIDVINSTYQRHIVTAEDPIEFLHKPKQSIFSQREVGWHTPSFAAAVRSAIRQDADVILVGELRDPETIALALLAAEMGALVFATLHTNSAPKTIDRLVDAFPAEEQGHIRLMLSDTLAAVIAQVLLPTVDGKGRVPATEILLKTSALPTMIRDNNVPLLMSYMQSGRALGMQSMDDALEQLVKSGRVRYDDALRRASDRPRFEQRAKPRDESAP